MNTLFYDELTSTSEMNMATIRLAAGVFCPITDANAVRPKLPGGRKGELSVSEAHLRLIGLIQFFRLQDSGKYLVAEAKVLGCLPDVG